MLLYDSFILFEEFATEMHYLPEAFAEKSSPLSKLWYNDSTSF